MRMGHKQLERNGKGHGIWIYVYILDGYVLHMHVIMFSYVYMILFLDAKFEPEV